MHSSYLDFLPADLRSGLQVAPESRWWSWRGHEVHIERFAPADAPARILLIHGAGGHAGAMRPFAALAAAQGFEVEVPDLPGYGRTRTPSRRWIRYTDWGDLVTDLVRAAKSGDSRPLLLFGASMGGMLAYEGAARTGLADTVVATCLLDPRSPRVRAALTRRPWMGIHGPRMMRPVFDRVRIPMRWIAAMSAISNNPELTRVVCADPLGGGGRMPLGFLRGYLRSAPAVEPEQFTTCPVLLVHPGADRWTPLPLSRLFFDRIAAPKRLLVLDNAGHYPIEEPGIRQLIHALAGLATVRDRHG